MSKYLKFEKNQLTKSEISELKRAMTNSKFDIQFTKENNSHTAYILVGNRTVLLETNDFKIFKVVDVMEI